MKDFTDICRMSQQELKTYMQKYLAGKKYTVINEDGFLYAKGTVPVLLLAHMDTVHKLPCTQIHQVDGKVSSPQGIGGDDRCGIFIIMNLVKELHCSVLLCEDEETGGVGARKFAKTDYVKNLDVNYMIEFDRKGKSDAVFYSCDNEDFTKFVTSNIPYTKAYGSFSDISVVAPAAKIAAVNLSSGYYKAHTTEEYVVYDEMMATVEAAKTLIKTETEPFEYIEKKYERYPCYDDYGYYGYGYGYGYGNGYKEPSLLPVDNKIDFDIEIEVTWINELGEEMIGNASGATKAEAWAKFFILYPEVCFNMINDYCFC